MIVTYCLHLQANATTIEISEPQENVNRLSHIQQECLKHYYRTSRGYSVGDVSPEDVVILLIS